MKIVKVRSCDGCPFESDGDGRPFCNAHPNGPPTEPRYHDAKWMARPDRCPLELGPVTVEVDRG